MIDKEELKILKEECAKSGMYEEWFMYNDELKRLIKTIRKKKIKNIFN